MKLERSIAGWAQSSPHAMARQSPAAIEYALADAQKDILTLARILASIGYPKRGAEEAMTLQQHATRIQAVITHDEAVNHL